MEKKKSDLGVLLGAAFIMAISSSGPGFLTQTAKFVNDYHGGFGFVILISMILAIIVQLNVWRVLCVSGLRGQDVANKVLPGMGYVIAALIVIGGLVFNIGNVGGGALGFNALLGVDLKWGYIITCAFGVLIFLFKNAGKAMDMLTKVLGGIMIAIILLFIFIVHPPVGMALKETFVPSVGYTTLFPAILTLLGGTVGGYITFSGAHRLIDAGITKEEHLGQIKKSSVMGIGVATLVRILLFLAILGVVVKGVSLDPSNPAADAFKQGAGELGYRFFGLVLISASITAVVGAAYTSVSFLKTLSKTVAKYEKWFIVGFIILSTLVMEVLGQPAQLLVLAGALNGLILPLTLGICLVASQKPEIMGKSYHHPKVLLILGIVVVILSAYLGITSLGKLFA
jgi:Mn2+/Fe2+ NRAMP family transporter